VLENKAANLGCARYGTTRQAYFRLALSEVVLLIS
jgi:hypothetical protein